MEALFEQAKLFINLSEKLNNGDVTLQDLPLQTLMGIIDSIYQTISIRSSGATDTYRDILKDAYDADCREDVSKLLQLIGFHLIMFGEKKIELQEKSNKSMQLQCQLSYIKNQKKLETMQNSKDVVPFSGRGVIYTAIFGEYDKVYTPKVIDKELSYILFTDNPNIESDVWMVKVIDPYKTEELQDIVFDSAKISRKIKVLGYQYLSDYDYSIWVDGSMEITGELCAYVDKYRQKEPILCVNHSQTDCIYNEAQTCINLKKDNSKVIEEQIQRYREEHYPEHYGLIESGLLVRELHNQKLNEAMDLWWQEIKNGSRRDQLSFNYVCWKKQMLYDTSDVVIWNNEYVSVGKHNQIPDRRDII